MSDDPLSVTPLGAIAYRLDAIASAICDRHGVDEARPLWGIVDDLVAYGMNVKDSADG